jgi:pyocin large subunit-like protein
VQQPTARPEWRSRRLLEEHFRDHGAEVGASTVDEYDRSARTTIRVGVRIPYEDRTTGLTRIGYFQPRSRKFTALTEDETIILSHFRAESEGYVHRLRRRTY